MAGDTEGDRADVLAAVRAARRAIMVRSWLPERTVRWRRFAVGGLVVLGLVVLGVLQFARATPVAESPPPLPAAVARSSSSAPRPTTLVVSVVGRVTHTGLVQIPDGSRVADAIAAAGGALPGVDLTTINLARKVNDGEQLFVGIPAPAWAQQAGPAPGAPSAAGQPGGKVNLNSATAEQLDQLPGVGTVTAKRILDWRTQHGRFTTVEQLKDVGGIGDTKFARLKDQVTVG